MAASHTRTRPVQSDGEEDQVESMINKTGCLKLHYAVQDCMAEHKDWRKCQQEVADFKKCIDENRLKKTHN